LHDAGTQIRPPSRGPYGITSQVSSNPKSEQTPQRPTGPQATRPPPGLTPDRNQANPETRLNPRCARPTANQPPPTHPFLSSTLSKERSRSREPSSHQRNRPYWGAEPGLADFVASPRGGPRRTPM